MIEPNFEFLHGRTTKNMIELPKSREEDIDEYSDDSPHSGSQPGLACEASPGVRDSPLNQWITGELLLYDRAGELLDKDA